MFRARRRPLLRAAMIGGAGYVAGRAGQRGADREDDQEQRLQELEAQGQPAAPATAGSDLVTRLKELSELQASGALSQEEFDTAKTKLLAS